MMTPPLSTIEEISLVVVSVLGSTGWYAANRKFVGPRTPAAGVSTGDSRDRASPFAIIVPAFACLALLLANWTAVLPADARGFGSLSASGVLLTIVAGVLIGVFYRVIAFATSSEYGGLGVFAVSYYVPLLGLVALAGFFLGDKPPNAMGWSGLLVALPAIVLMRWTKPDKTKPDEKKPDLSSQTPSRPGLWKKFLVLACVTLTSFGWLCLQRLVLGRREVYHMSAGAFCIICLAVAPLTVFVLSKERSTVAQQILASLRASAQLGVLALGSVSLAAMYIGLAIELVHDMTRILWLYYVLMIVMLAFTGQFYFRDRLARHQLLGMGLAIVAAVLIYLGKSNL